ncbi:hypothetical protein J5681_02810 [bacterium]|nr:hypothetical protein [bacterium]
MKFVTISLLFLCSFLVSCNSETNCLTKDDLPKRECLTKSEFPETVTCDLAKNCLTQNELAQIVSCKEKLSDPTKNELAADRAFEEGTKLLSAGKFDEAKIYFVNAINHDPNEINYYKKLFETMKKMKLDSEDLAELKTIFELGIYRVDSAHIKDLNENIIPEIEKRINEKNIASEKAESAAESSEPVNIKKELSDLEKGELSFSKLLKSKETKKSKKIEDRLTQLAAMKEYAESNELDAEFEKTKTLLQYAIILETVDKYLSTSEALLNRNDEKFFPSIESVLQNAKVTLSQAWNIDLDSLKEGDSDPAVVINDYAKQIDDKIKLFSRKKSEPVMKKIRQLVEQVDPENKKILDNQSIPNPRTVVLNNYQKARMEISKLSPAVYGDEESRDKVEEYIRNLTTSIQNAEKVRLKAYQKWATLQIQTALEVYKADSSDASALAGCGYLVQIDAQLLIPEVSALYSSVLGQFENQFGRNWEDATLCRRWIAIPERVSTDEYKTKIMEAMKKEKIEKILKNTLSISPIITGPLELINKDNESNLKGTVPNIKKSLEDF